MGRGLIGGLRPLRKLGRTAAHRDAMFRTMLGSLIRHERIRTTLPKAKELKRIADRVVNFAKKGLHDKGALCRVAAYLREAQMVNKLTHTLVPRFKDRTGGFTRIIHTPYWRRGDAAEYAYIEFIDNPHSIKESAVLTSAAKLDRMKQFAQLLRKTSKIARDWRGFKSRSYRALKNRDPDWNFFLKLPSDLSDPRVTNKPLVGPVMDEEERKRVFEKNQEAIEAAAARKAERDIRLFAKRIRKEAEATGLEFEDVQTDREKMKTMKT